MIKATLVWWTNLAKRDTGHGEDARYAAWRRAVPKANAAAHYA